MLPDLLTPIPGPASRSLVDTLSLYECPAITARRARRAATLGTADDDPIVWAEASGANVWDADGNRYVDLTSGFGVAFVGHRHPEVVAAVRAQQDRLLHAMGDVAPDPARIHLLERLASVTPPGLDITILGLSGSDAVEAALKTAVLATGRPGVLSFSGAYHGLALGPLPHQAYKQAFTEPFADIVDDHAHHLPYGGDLARVEDVLRSNAIGLVLVEPVQGRGGMRAPPEGWLAGLAEAARRHGALLAFDEIQCGLGRTGAMFAADTAGVVPDLLLVGKALAGGFPLSACVGTRPVMEAWGASKGEAIHTQTFLGHPIGCAAALAVLELLVRDALPRRATEVGGHLAASLRDRGFTVTGPGLMRAVHTGSKTLAISRRLLRSGYLVLPAGERGDVLGLTPPVFLSEAQSEAFADALRAASEA